MIYGEYVVADAFNMYAKVGNKTVISEEDLTDCGFDLTTTTQMVKAGQYNKIIAVLRGEKELKVESTTPKFNLSNLAFSLGQDIVVGAGIGISKMQKFKIDASKKITLAHTPKDEGELEIFIEGKPLEKTTDYTYASGIITFVGDNDLEDKVGVVYPYKYQTNENTQSIKIDGSSFPEGVTLYLQTFAVNKNDKKEGILQFKFNNAVADGAVSFATTSERKAINNKMSFTIIEDDEGELGEVTFIPNDVA